MRKSESDGRMMVLTQKNKGFIFKSVTKMRVMFDDEIDGEALQLFIDNYEV